MTKEPNLLCDPETGLCTPLSDELLETSLVDNERKTELIYVGDPMCSWCWGISKDLKLVIDAFKSELNFKFICGGLYPGGRGEWDENTKSFLMHHWKEIEERTGQQFNYDLFDKEEFNYDTEPPSRAVVIAKELTPEKAFDFFVAIKERFYVQNGDPNELAFYLPLCDQFGIDKKLFRMKFSDPNYMKKSFLEFQRAAELGVRAFPTILLKAEEIHTVTRGYADGQTMITRVNQLLNQLA